MAERKNGIAVIEGDEAQAAELLSTYRVPVLDSYPPIAHDDSFEYLGKRAAKYIKLLEAITDKCAEVGNLKLAANVALALAKLSVLATGRMKTITDERLRPERDLSAVSSEQLEQILSAGEDEEV